MEDNKKQNNIEEKKSPTQRKVIDRSFNKRRPKRRVVKNEFNEKMIDLRRVSRVVKGGKRFSFRATLVIGDGKGRVGVGIGKGKDVAQAMEKARNDAKKNIITVALKGTTILHVVEAKYSAARVMIKPSPKGSGLRAGSAVRAVLSLAGIKDVSSKVLGKTKNKLTNALAAIDALKMLEPKKIKKNSDKDVDLKDLKELKK